VLGNRPGAVGHAYPGTQARRGAAGRRVTWRVEGRWQPRWPELTVAGWAAPVLYPAPEYVDSASGEVVTGRNRYAATAVLRRHVKRRRSTRKMPPERRRMAVALPAGRMPAASVRHMAEPWAA